MNFPTVSVCIPAYNGERFIGEAISSVLNQTFSDWELIICDDCSKDNTAKIVESFNDPRIRFYINLKNIGITANHNLCIELSKGKYICSVFHQDDVMSKINLDKKVELLDKNNSVGMVHSNIYLIDEEGIIIGGHWAKNNSKDLITNGFAFFKMHLLGTNEVCAPSVMVRKECYEKLGGFDLRLPYTFDYEMWLRIALYYDIAYLSEPLLYYRWHSNNLTNKFNTRLEGIKQGYLARKIAIEKNLGRLQDGDILLKKVKLNVSEISLNKAISFHKNKSYLLALKHLYFALKLYPLIVKKWLFRRLIIKMIFGTKAVSRINTILGRN